ncbi:MAG: neutral/alkaline non-lysosomal ceramidase N-terminal domain-containing protein [Spirochaetia bacterium]
MSTLKIGTGVADITPKKSIFLYGYPHVERYSTGVHDPLYSTALYLEDGTTRALILANDIAGFDKPLAQKIKSGISEKTGIPRNHIILSATHTHSGPRTTQHIANENDPVVPPPDQEYLDFMSRQVIEAGISAAQEPREASAEFAEGNGEGIGTNRRDPAGPADLSVPVLVFRDNDGKALACMLVCSMHPTVLHEDSKLVSADFPGMSRKYLQEKVFSPSVPVLHLMGASGNQSPRHVTKSNTFEEAERLGQILGKAVEKAAGEAKPLEQPVLDVRSAEVDLPRKQFPPLEEAEERLRGAINRLENLRKNGAPSQEVRTAECDWFGAEEIVTLARADQQGKLEESYSSSLPAEITAIGIGGHYIVGWPCEIFIEYQLDLKKQVSRSYPVSLSNGELHGYIVTEEAAEEGGYEASNSLFGPDAGKRIVEETVNLLKG